MASKTSKISPDTFLGDDDNSRTELKGTQGNGLEIDVDKNQVAVKDVKVSADISPKGQEDSKNETDVFKT